MIQPADFVNALKGQGVDFFTGVPDSLLKEFGAYVMDAIEPHKHIIAANEGGAIGLAAGYHLGTGRVPLVYMQNSGLGNTVNPLLSLADKEVYGIPMLLLIGWRGEPGVKDEPQHIKQGRVQLSMLDSMEIPYRIIDKNTANFGDVVAEMVKKAREISNPVALVVRAGTFGAYKMLRLPEPDLEMDREAAIITVLSSISKNDVVISTTGKASREVFEYRARNNEGHSKDFLTVGSMGHSVMIALGVAIAKPQKRVVCLDGDGAILMQLGALAITGTMAPNNFIHIVINNGAHDSVGGQPTAGFLIDFSKVAKACCYKNVAVVDSSDELKKTVETFASASGPGFIEVKVKKGGRDDLGRPTTTPAFNKMQLMEFLMKAY